MGKLSHALQTTQSKRVTVTLLHVSLRFGLIFLKCTHDEPWRFSPPGSPANFLPAVRTTVDSKGKIVVSISCVSEASPTAVVLWTDGRKALTNGTTYQIINNTTQLSIHHYNVSSFLLNNYTCVCSNPLGSQTSQAQLKGMCRYFEQGLLTGLTLGPKFFYGHYLTTHFWAFCPLSSMK